MVCVEVNGVGSIMIIGFIVAICSVSAIDLGWDRFVQTIPSAFYSVSTPNVLRCGKLCERQGKCAAVTFDVRERKCYMHDSPINASQTGKGRYLIKNYGAESKRDVSENTCDPETQISIPTMYHKYGGCYNITEINECDPSPCQNNATCEDKKNDFHCNCEAGFTGKICSVDINECESTPSGNNGICVDKVNDYFCNCSAGFTGRNCSDTSCPKDSGYQLWTYSDMTLCIRYSLTPVSDYDDASDQCASTGGHLVLIENDNMRSHLVDIAKSCGAPTNEWTYLNGRRENSTSLWIDWKGNEVNWLSWVQNYSYNDNCLLSKVDDEFYLVKGHCPFSRVYLFCQIDI